MVAIAHTDGARLADAAGTADDVSTTSDWREAVESDDVQIVANLASSELELLGDFAAEGCVQQVCHVGAPFTVLDHLLESPHDGKNPISPVEKNRTNLAVCLAFYEAAREHKVVESTEVTATG